MTKNNLFFSVAFLISIIFARVSFDIINQIEVHFDEAQYWVWSQNLSLSYLSKGPLAPSLIAFSNLIFGQSYLGLKFFSFLAYLGTIIFLSIAALKLSNKKEGFTKSLIFSALSPTLFVLGGVASTDIYLFFFWSLTILCYIFFFEDRNERWFYIIGVTTGLGILAKLTMILLPVSILIYFLATDLRKYFFNIHIYLSALVTVIICSPILIWNSKNDCVTIFHEINHLVSEEPSFNPEILILTLILTLPSILFILETKIRKNFFSSKYGFLIYPTFILILFFIVKSFTGKIQLNWSIPIFLGLIPILASLPDVSKERGALLGILILVPLFLVSNKGISSLITTYDPLHPVRGWNETYQNLFRDVDYDYIASENYKLLSTAAYFQKDAKNLFLSKTNDRRLTHYDLWKRDLKPSDKILFVSNSKNEAPFNNLTCTTIREVKKFHRKQLSLYNCTSK